MLKATVSILVLLGVSVLFGGGSPQTTLPQRIVHRESGIALILIPAGRFQMGSPENDRPAVRTTRQPSTVTRA